MSQSRYIVLSPIASIIAGYLLSKIDPVEGIFAPYLIAKWQLPVLLSLSLLLCILIPCRILQNSKHKNHTKEQEALFKAALKIIGARSHITLDYINEFKTTYDENKFLIKRNQEKVLSGLLSDLQDLRIFKEERKGNVSNSERISLVAKERELLNRIESIKPTIENYLKKLT